MNVPKFERTKFVGKDKEEITLFQDSTRKVLDVIEKKEIIHGQLLENISCPNMATTKIAHGLGRKARGAIVVAQSVFATFQVNTNNVIQDSTQYITVWNTSSNDAIISLWVL